MPASATDAVRAVMTVRRRQWADLPESARAAIQEQTGPGVGIRSARAGVTSGLAAHIAAAEGVFFVKAARPARPGH
ncbi:hypothetical protein GCM10018952_37490 [Streptosporangium vulgare]